MAKKGVKVIFDPLVPDFGIVEQWKLHGEVRVTSRNINIIGLSRLNIFPVVPNMRIYISKRCRQFIVNIVMYK